VDGRNAASVEEDSFGGRGFAAVDMCLSQSACVHFFSVEANPYSNTNVPNFRQTRRFYRVKVC
jgi:hypothetical protein